VMHAYWVGLKAAKTMQSHCVYILLKTSSQQWYISDQFKSGSHSGHVLVYAKKSNYLDYGEQ
jgi:hypothetical protein